MFIEQTVYFIQDHNNFSKDLAAYIGIPKYTYTEGHTPTCTSYFVHSTHYNARLNVELGFCACVNSGAVAIFIDMILSMLFFSTAFKAVISLFFTNEGCVSWTDGGNLLVQTVETLVILLLSS